ncbi:putative HTH-type transcriptional regulator [Gemmata obscuriglobus]|uniref:MarR family transcriptional regulator n=1 Tax=Gemmata obscuriglobus TaxID=114 RepID=A0A2Z3GX98_9BACT|nr:MarR family winged helix-turn-helix transcriptional regulator [Gemmata obscuriglobus]AWM38018.1 MarR family transcriptional regulator [Gemmata obscuriglobus]QEG29114.1 putative HTH-type transcriptional regulator [Gemmata obscuriglobus]VTS07803.1 family transcriptional regulator : MarR family transcriptional regulator OS=Asticcacaulis sp. AC460 GN=ABAC460_08740 PE=4 SV=1: MarR_2 [Gemmata obscuriglobus UQM 2246]
MSHVPSPLDAHIGFWLRFISNHVSHAFAAKVEGHGVTVAEWVVLRQLLTTGATAPSALAEGLGLTRGAVSKLVDRLCAKCLVSRTANQEDKRYQTVALTPTGHELVPKLADVADANDAEFFGHLNDDQRAMLVGLMKDVVRRHGLKDVPIE